MKYVRLLTLASLGLIAPMLALASTTIVAESSTVSSVRVSARTAVNHLTERMTGTAVAQSGVGNLERVPEPGTLAMLGAGLIGLFAVRRRLLN